VEPILDERGRIRGTPEARAALLRKAEHTLGAMVRSMAIEEQIWSASGGVHLAGIWHATEAPVLVKLGVNPNQLYWTRQIEGAAPDLIPQLFASGDTLDDLPVAWTVMERIPCDALGPGWMGNEFEMVLDAAVRFQRASRSIEPRTLETMDAALLRERLEVGVTARPPGPVGTLIDRLESDWQWVSAVCELEICHGDVHMCNVLSRIPPPDYSTAVLIDCQPVVQPWAFDAAYPQVLNSTDRGRIGYQDLVPKMARIRTAYGLSSCAGADLERLSRLTLAWFAIRLWGLTPDRHSIPDYRAETERYIRDGAETDDRMTR
jgi:hypothetical protein